MNRRRPLRTNGLVDDPAWYKDAVIYELRTRSFFDSDGDGIGDFRGVLSKLDYLHDLGITALWLLPFYPSPGRDDGYDISDYTAVHPDVGTLADFELLLNEAHRRGIRVITELVLNHTSDEHPWFQRARRAPPGSPERDFYVWSDTPDRYRDARIIFKDFETSNWTWDPEAKAYFWHRFYGHQPDLNFRNPAVEEALLGVVDFWLDKGVDGLRLDAVPYLYETEGTHCENLPETHAFLRKLRAHIDSKYRNRMLLAEANQWPEDAAAYFGSGDECHMNFHFPLMPRMFMSIHMEDRLPLTDIFAQTPVVHPTCQWALFLRNHDELTLEMVTDEERDYMYRAYADEAAMRINLGIRRRLAPLVGNDRRKMELLNGLLFSLPGTPVLYYGDEIGMGDNVYLGDRNGVRTPMQWTLDRNAGFSRANPQRLILPVVIDPEYHYASINVENQQQNPTSLLWWTKRLIALRKRFTAFGRGTIEFLQPSNPSVLAFIRAHGEERVLVVANLSRFAQFAELDLRGYEGCLPVELFGKTKFPRVGAHPYLLTLGPHAFYWLSLDLTAQVGDRRSPTRVAPMIECTSLDALLLGGEHERIESLLPAFLASRPWLRRGDATMRACVLEDVLELKSAGTPLYLAIVHVDYVEGPAESYVLPLALWNGEDRPAPEAVLCSVRLGEAETAVPLVDALDEPRLSAGVLAAIGAKESSVHGTNVVSAFTLGPITIGDGDGDGHGTADAQPLAQRRASSAVRFGDRFVLKLLRRLEDGTHPEVEMGRFLAGSDLVPPLLGAMSLRRERSEPATVALVHGFVPNLGTAWDWAIQELTRFYERVLAKGPHEPPPPLPPQTSPLLLVGHDPATEVGKMIGTYRDTAAQIGRRVADLHLALASSKGNPDFAPTPYTALDRRSKYQSLRTLSSKVLRALRQRLGSLPPRARREAEAILSKEAEVLRSFEPLLASTTSALRIRCHGDLHLGNVLHTGKDFVLVDFAGNPELSLAERRRKRSPLRDLAGMVRSFEFAALKVLLDPARVRESDCDAARPWAFQWASWISASFLGSYFAATEGAPFIPTGVDQKALFDAFVMERALYQLLRELDVPSDGVTIPLLGIARSLGIATTGSSPPAQYL